MILWRLCQQRYAARPLNGEGARLYGGRWNFPGVSVVYTAGTLALAVLEVLVHVDPDLIPADLVAIPIDVPRRLRLEELSISMLPPNWRSVPAPERLQQLGTAWVQSVTSAVLRVPSAVVPEEHNYLVNTAHPSCRRLTIGKPQPFTFDPRLFK